MSDGWPGDEIREQASSLADEAQDLRKRLAIANTTVANLRDALGICHAAMERHDDNHLPMNEHPAGTCLVDFEAEREIALKALTVPVKNALSLGFCDRCDESIYEGQEYVVDHAMVCKQCFEDYGLNGSLTQDGKDKESNHFILNSPPRYDGEIYLRDQKIELNDDAYGPPSVNCFVDLYVGQLLPGTDGLELRWQRRSVWLQTPIANMWELADNAQVPLKIVNPRE